MGNETFKKREKEAARREKQKKKAARRIERKNEKVNPEKEDVEAERPLLEAVPGSQIQGVLETDEHKRT